MDHGPSSPVREYGPHKTEGDKLTPVVQPREDHADHESSSSDVPLRHQRPRRAPTQERDDSADLHGHRQLRNPTHDINTTSLLDERRAEHNATLCKPPKAAAKSTGKALKKPGPRPWASKPIMKNDMAAKKEVIREIESYWGKDFIKAYIPKCHRPLVKRGKSGKRAMYRDHETDPKEWLPSVLKAVLMIAKLTNNKTWLKKAMNDVVRYRIKNTGNRKPQLVTTDFDVIEDMLVKDWDVAYSFKIRYKHLLVNRQGQQDTDEDIDHILGVESGQEDVSDEGDCGDHGDVQHDVKSDHDNDEDDEDAENADESDDDMGRGGRTGQYLHASSYTNAPQYPHPYPVPGTAPKHPKAKQEKSPRRKSKLLLRPLPPAHNQKGPQGYNQPYRYSPPVNLWSGTMPYDGYGRYGGYGMYGGYGGYGPPPELNGRHPSQPPGFASMGQYPPSSHAMNPASSQPDIDRTIHSNRRMQGGIERSPFTMVHQGLQPHGYSQNVQGGQPEVKQEPTETEVHRDGHQMSADEVDSPTDDLGEDSNAAAVEAELRATELELKVVRLQARRAAMNQQSRAT